MFNESLLMSHARHACRGLLWRYILRPLGRDSAAQAWEAPPEASDCASYGFGATYAARGIKCYAQSSRGAKPTGPGGRPKALGAATAAACGPAPPCRMALAPRLLPAVRAVEAYRASAPAEPLVADIGCYVGNLAARLARGGRESREDAPKKQEPWNRSYPRS